jgi:hypothetical protein
MEVNNQADVLKWECISRLLSAHVYNSDLIAQEFEFIIDRLIKDLEKV